MPKKTTKKTNNKKQDEKEKLEKKVNQTKEEAHKKGEKFKEKAEHLIEEAKDYIKEEFEEHVEDKIEKYAKKHFAEKFSDHPQMKKILNSDFVKNINENLKPNRSIIFKVIGILAIIGGIFGIIGFFKHLSIMGRIFRIMFHGGFLLLGLLNFLNVFILLGISVLALIIGYGILNKKKWTVFIIKWTVFIIFINFIISIISLIIMLLSLSTNTAGNITNSILSIIFSFIFLVYTLKNSDYFGIIKKTVSTAKKVKKATKNKK